MKKERLWTQSFIFIMLINLFASMMNFTLLTTIPLYVEYLGKSNSIAGTITMVYSLSSLLTRPFWGYLTDRIGRRTVMVMGAVIFIAVSLLYHAAQDLVLLLIIRILNGIGFSAVTTAAYAAAADVLPPSRRSEGIGFFGIALTAATAIGPAIGLLFVNDFGYTALFFFALLISILELCCAWNLKYEQQPVWGKSKPAREAAGNRFHIRLSDCYDRSALRPSFVLFLVSVCNSSVISFITLFGATRGIDNIGMYFTVYACAVIATRLFIGKTTDRLGVTRILLVGLLLQLTAFILLAGAKTLTSILIAAAVSGLGGGAVTPLINIIVIRLCTPERRGVAMGTMNAAMDIGVGLGALVWGIMIDRTGFQAVYFASAAIIAVAAATYMLLVWKSADKKTG